MRWDELLLTGRRGYKRCIFWILPKIRKHMKNTKDNNAYVQIFIRSYSLNVWFCVCCGWVGLWASTVRSHCLCDLGFDAVYVVYATHGHIHRNMLEHTTHSQPLPKPFLKLPLKTHKPVLSFSIPPFFFCMICSYTKILIKMICS